MAAALAADFVEPLDEEEFADGITPPPKVRGIKGLPKGVSTVKGKYQGRVSYKPTLESSTKQRSVGLFSTVLEAAQAVADAEQTLAAGGDPWAAPARVNKHKRGEAPPQGRKTARRKGIYTSEKSAAKNGGTFTKPAEQRDAQLPTSVPMPASVDEITNVHMATLLDDRYDEHMSAFLAQRSGEDL